MNSELTMDKLKMYLSKEFGIKSADELIKRAKKSEPINIGIFTTPITGAKKIS